MGGYSLSQLSKAIVSLIFLGGYVALIFTTFNPGLITAVALLVPAAFAVFGVFAAKNHTPDDLQKALEQMKMAVLSVVSYFTIVPASTTNKISMAVGALVSVIGVYWARNTDHA